MVRRMLNRRQLQSILSFSSDNIKAQLRILRDYVPRSKSPPVGYSREKRSITKHKIEKSYTAFTKFSLVNLKDGSSIVTYQPGISTFIGLSDVIALFRVKRKRKQLATLSWIGSKRGGLSKINKRWRVGTEIYYGRRV